MKKILKIFAKLLKIAVILSIAAIMLGFIFSYQKLPPSYPKEALDYELYQDLHSNIGMQKALSLKHGEFEYLINPQNIIKFKSNNLTLIEVQLRDKDLVFNLVRPIRASNDFIKNFLVDHRCYKINNHEKCYQNFNFRLKYKLMPDFCKREIFLVEDSIIRCQSLCERMEPKCTAKILKPEYSVETIFNREGLETFDQLKVLEEAIKRNITVTRVSK